MSQSKSLMRQSGLHEETGLGRMEKAPADSEPHAGNGPDGHQGAAKQSPSRTLTSLGLTRWSTSPKIWHRPAPQLQPLQLTFSSAFHAWRPATSPSCPSGATERAFGAFPPCGTPQAAGGGERDGEGKGVEVVSGARRLRPSWFPGCARRWRSSCSCSSSREDGGGLELRPDLRVGAARDTGHSGPTGRARACAAQPRSVVCPPPPSLLSPPLPPPRSVRGNWSLPSPPAGAARLGGPSLTSLRRCRVGLRRLRPSRRAQTGFATVSRLAG